jgi:uncharacterized protein (DUF4415 family)
LRRRSWSSMIPMRLHCATRGMTKPKNALSHSALFERVSLPLSCTRVLKTREEVIRLISARKATPQERSIYEAARQRTAAGDRGPRRHGLRTLLWRICRKSRTGAEIGRFYRPKKRPVTLRLDEDLVDWLKGYGPGYQTKANLLLRHAMQSAKGRRAKK